MKTRAFLPVIIVLAMLVLACSVCGDLGNLQSGISELQEQATALATYIPDEETIEALIEEIEEPVATEEITEPPEKAIEETPTTAAEEEPAAELDLEGETEDVPLDLDMSMSGLEDLNSYRSDMYVEWEGIEGGEPVTGYITVELAFVREPPAYEMHFEGQGLEGDTDQGLGKVSFIQVGNNSWFYEGETDTWMQVPSGDFGFDEGFFFAPQDFFSEFDTSTGKRSLVPQNVNGVLCDKYTFTEKDLQVLDPDEGDIVRAQGEAFVAVDGGYMVKLEMEAEMTSKAGDEFAAFEKGTILMEFEVYDINQPIVIEPPAEAEEQTQERQDIPILPDAEIEFSSPDFITYKTASSVQDATEFYETEMAKQGWESSGDSFVMEDTAMLSFEKDGATASIMISAGEQDTDVIIAVESEGGVEGGGDIQEPQSRDDVPMLADADLDSFSTADYIIYQTGSSSAEVGQFYEREMPKNGWKSVEGNNPADLAAAGYLEYTKGEELADVYATEIDGQTQVEILIW